MKDNYRLVRKRLTLVILIVKLAEEVCKLLNMANNYSKFRSSLRYAFP